MAAKQIRVSISDEMSDLIRDLGNAEFQRMLDLIELLPDDLDEFSRTHTSALSVIARLRPYAFVCVRTSHSSNQWVVVEIYDDCDPDDLPPGGGRRFSMSEYHTDGSGFRALPPAIRDLFRYAFDFEDEEAYPPKEPWVMNVSADISVVEISIPAVDILYNDFLSDYFFPALPSTAPDTYIDMISARYLSQHQAAGIKPEPSLMPLIEKFVPEEHPRHKPQPN